ncbi:UNVERIFIED_CONTAM: hypothetical protein FKN15_044551 [Acipenser sinensis]
MESLASANTIFALDLFKKLSNDRKAENIFYSPLSISSALAMVYLGARGNTASEMAQVCAAQALEELQFLVVFRPLTLGPGQLVLILSRGFCFGLFSPGVLVELTVLPKHIPH